MRKSPASSPWSLDTCCEELLTLHGQGLTGSQIADALDAKFPEFAPFGRAKVLARLNRLGLEGNGPKGFPRGVKSAISQFTRRPKHPRKKDTYRYDVGRQATNATVSAVRSTRLGACKFPIGDPRADDFRFCGADHHNDGPYCDEHHELTHEPPRSSARARARLVDDLRFGFRRERGRRFVAH